MYLDHAGATLYSERQLQHVYSDLAHAVHTNPHSSEGMAACVEQARRDTLQLLNASEEEYEVVFTGGATGTLWWMRGGLGLVVCRNGCMVHTPIHLLYVPFHTHIHTICIHTIYTHIL